MNANIFERANEIIRKCNTAYLGVIDDSGYPSVSTVSPLKHESILEVHFATGFVGNKVQRLQNNSKASICFHSGDNNITLVGQAEILTDQESKDRYWLDWFNEIFDSKTDPNYCVVKVKTERVSLWIDDEDAQFSVDQLLTVQSYCGLLCDGCRFKESHGCIGCIALQGKPFWGECDVAACCQSKGYSHCGQCADMPCDKLRDMSYGEGEHCDTPKGARIAVCKAWAAK